MILKKHCYICFSKNFNLSHLHMSQHKNFLSYFKIFIKVFLISALGLIVLFKLTGILFDDLDSGFLPILIPSIIAILIIVVCLIFTEIFKFINQGMVGELKRYDPSVIIMMLFKCFIIILSGFTLAILYKLNIAKNEESDFPDLLFFIGDSLLVIYSLIGVVKTEQLREINFSKLETENRLLKTRINPHFLYNTLNNIDSLIWIDQDKASESIVRLSSLMRYMTYQTDKPYVSLNDELSHIEEYLALQKIRYDNPDAIVFRKEITDGKDIYISPMTLISFVENGFKHCSDKSTDGAIIINIKANKRKLEFYMDNSYDETETGNVRQGGFGLVGVERRLKLMYRKNYDLSIKKENNRFKVRLTIIFDNEDYI